MVFGKKKKEVSADTKDTNEGDENVAEDSSKEQAEVLETTVEESVELSQEEILALQAKAAEADEYKSKHLYLAAEFDNFRKRIARERKDQMDYAEQNILFDLLSIMDNFALALKADQDETDPKVIIEGIEMIRKQFDKLLERHNVTAIPTKGEMFNPEIHEALQQVPIPGMQAGEIIEELQKGYKLRKRLLRASCVVVAKELEAPVEESENTDDAEVNPAE